MRKSFTKMLPQMRECFALFPVEKAWVFGSVSRGEDRPDSDIDIMVRYRKEPDLSLLTTARLYRSLVNALGRECDVVEEGFLMPYAETSANQDRILIYERAD